MTTFAGTRAHLLFERNLMVYRRSWLIIFSGLFEPLFYLASIGFGASTASRTRATSRRRCSRRRR